MSERNELDVVRRKKEADAAWKFALKILPVSEQLESLYEHAHAWYRTRDPERRRDLARMTGVAIYYLCEDTNPIEAVREALTAWPDLPGDAIRETLEDKRARWQGHPNHLRVQVVSEALAGIIWDALTQRPLCRTASASSIAPSTTTSSSTSVVPVVLKPTLEVTEKTVERRGHRYRVVLLNGEPHELPAGQLQALTDELYSHNRKPDKHALSSVRAWLSERGLPRDLTAIRVTGLDEPGRSVEVVKTDK